MEVLHAIDLNISERLKDRDFRREWFRAELESSVPETFRELRELRGLTQGDLAKAVGTKQPSVSRFERSSSPVWDFEFLLRLAEALDARLRVVVEPAEAVVGQYNEPSEGIDKGSAFHDWAQKNQGRKQESRNTFATDITNGIAQRNEPDIDRRMQSPLPNKADREVGTAISSKRDKGDSRSIQLSELPPISRGSFDGSQKL